jgi:hypothetical protein
MLHVYINVMLRRKLEICIKPKILVKVFHSNNFCFQGEKDEHAQPLGDHTVGRKEYNSSAFPEFQYAVFLNSLCCFALSCVIQQ